MKKALLVILQLCGLISAPVSAQLGFSLYPGRKQVEIPFEYTNNFIILTVRFDDILPLRFIFDTGAEFTILSKKEITDLLHIPYEQKFQVAGSDLNNPLTAYLVRNVPLTIPQKASARGEDILVLEEDYFRFEEYAGVAVDGILSANAFSRYIITINYHRHVIQLTERENYRLPAGFETFPVDVFRNKIYLHTQLNIRKDTSVTVKLLIDTGAGLPLMLFTNTHPFLHAPTNAIVSDIGMGLGGFIQGFTGRVHRLELGSFEQTEVITYFQEADTTRAAGLLNRRNGLLGNAILSRFTQVIDYQMGKISLKSNRYYKESYVFDRSGLSLIAGGDSLNRIYVHNVLPGSPGSDADIRPGDELLKIRRTAVRFLTLGIIQRMFIRKPGKHIRIILERDGEKMTKTIVLRDLI